MQGVAKRKLGAQLGKYLDSKDQQRTACRQDEVTRSNIGAALG